MISWRSPWYSSDLWKIDGHGVWFERAPEIGDDYDDGYWNIEHLPTCRVRRSKWVRTTDPGKGGYCANCDGSANEGDFLCNICRCCGEWVTVYDECCPLQYDIDYNGVLDLWYPGMNEERPQVSCDPDNPTLIAYYVDGSSYTDWETGCSEYESEAGWVVAPDEAVKLYKEFKFLP